MDEAILRTPGALDPATREAIAADDPPDELAPYLDKVTRHGMPIEGGGDVTSGTHSPMLDVGIGMGYVPAAAATPGTGLTIDVRGRPRRAHVVEKPIYRRKESA